MTWRCGSSGGQACAHVRCAQIESKPVGGRRAQTDPAPQPPPPETAGQSESSTGEAGASVGALPDGLQVAVPPIGVKVPPSLGPNVDEQPPGDRVSFVGCPPPQLVSRSK